MEKKNQQFVRRGQENIKNSNNPESKEAADPIEEQPLQAVDNMPEDDDVATAEEMEAFIKSRREQRMNKGTSRNDGAVSSSDEEDESLLFGTEDMNAMDPYLEPDPTLPWVEYKEPIFLSRGCNHCPESYVPVSEQELRSCCKVGSCNWMKGIRQPLEKPFDCVEVRFKNNRKDFFRIPDGIDVSDGDVVAVEGMPGHDVGIVSLTGEVCRIQMLKKKVNPESDTIKKLFRRAKASDIERWTEAIREEDNALKKTRQIAEEQGLVMKVNDIEYQGDHSKAIFYYTADDRVDFRNLIKVLADQFHVRIEMKQIGVRQEAGKVGGIGTCGRELCCSLWLTNFKSVTTSVAKTQQILPNPQKLAGQCGKLKCCLNFEYDVYVDALKDFPPANTPIRFQKGLALYRKTDVFRGIMWYAYEGENDLYAITAENVKKIIEMNQNQQYPEKLEDYQVELMSTAALAQESSSDEFERELSRMADDNTSTQPSGKQGDRGDRSERGGRGDRNHDRQPRQQQGDRQERPERRDRNRDRQPRQQQEGQRGNRESRQEPNQGERRHGDRHRR